MSLKAKIVFLMRQFPFIYPPRIIHSCREWIDNRVSKVGKYHAQRGPWYKTIFPRDFIHNPEPKTLGQANANAFFINRSYPTAEANLFYLQNSYVFGHKGFILTRRHEVFQEFSHNFGISTLKKMVKKKPFYFFTTRAKQINGVGAVLLSPESHNYYHWLNDVLPRIRLYQEIADQVDLFCIASNVPEKFVETLQLFNINNEKLIRISEREKVQFAHLYVSSLPGSEGRSPKWAVDYLRNVFIKPSHKFQPEKKLYFVRGEYARRILNEDELIKQLIRAGFEIVDPGSLPVSDQVSYAFQAKLIISAHGAALSNLLFCNEGIQIIELFSPDYFRTDCFYTLSSLLKLNYWYLAGNKTPDCKWGDMIIDIDKVEKTLQQL
jgi:hypothetical protein